MLLYLSLSETNFDFSDGLAPFMRRVACPKSQFFEILKYRFTESNLILVSYSLTRRKISQLDHDRSSAADIRNGRHLVAISDRSRDQAGWRTWKPRFTVIERNLHNVGDAFSGQLTILTGTFHRDILRQPDKRLFDRIPV